MACYDAFDLSAACFRTSGIPIFRPKCRIQPFAVFRLSGKSRQWWIHAPDSSGDGRPCGAGDVPKPGRGEVERRLPVRKRADDPSASPDLAQDALEWIVIWHVLIGAVVCSSGCRRWNSVTLTERHRSAARMSAPNINFLQRSRPKRTGEGPIGVSSEIF